jgi:hypothetical protein
MQELYRREATEDVSHLGAKQSWRETKDCKQIREDFVATWFTLPSIFPTPLELESNPRSSTSLATAHAEHGTLSRVLGFRVKEILKSIPQYDGSLEVLCIPWP